MTKDRARHDTPPPALALEYGHLEHPWDPVAAGWLVRTQDDGHVIHVVPMLFTTAILVSARLGAPSYVDRWCYMSTPEALAAAEAWTTDYPATEPSGWHRHPISGRRRPMGDASAEHRKY